MWLSALAAYQLLLAAGYALASYFPAGGVLAFALLAANLLWQAGLRMAEGRFLLPPFGGGPPAALWPALLQPAVLILSRQGLLIVLLAATSPWVQQIVRPMETLASPYELYRASNAGACAGLVLQPFLLEPLATRTLQTQIWSAVLFIYCVALAAFLICTAPAWREEPASNSRGQPRLVWPALWPTALSTGLLMCVTQNLTDRFPTLPALWALPLILYLASFVASFREGPGRERADRKIRVALGGALLLFLIPLRESVIRGGLHLILLGLALYLVCWALHRRMYLERPPAEQLGPFYVSLAVGGALGGLGVALVAPLLFSAYTEFPLLLGVLSLRYGWDSFRPRFRGWSSAIPLVIALSLAGTLTARMFHKEPGLRLRTRSFFGVLVVKKGQLAYGGGVEAAYRVEQTATVHGFQVHGIFRQRPTSYYTWNSGVGQALLGLRAAAPAKPRQIGVVGLGIGTLAAYGQPGDTYWFYEIDPAMIRLARDERFFTYLRDTQAQVKIVPGDARQTLEHPPPGTAACFDLLVLDAFIGRSPPTHLLTLEAVQGYSRRIRPDGLLAFNLSNPHYDLVRVVQAATDACGMFTVLWEDLTRDGLAMPSKWLVAAPRRETLAHLFPSQRIRPPAPAAEREIPWTDDFAPLLRAWLMGPSFISVTPRNTPEERPAS